jgi:hypothetical protein
MDALTQCLSLLVWNDKFQQQQNECSVDSEWVNVQLKSLSTMACSLQSFDHFLNLYLKFGVVNCLQFLMNLNRGNFENRTCFFVTTPFTSTTLG